MLVYLLIVAGFMLRLVPHMPNIAPVAAIALFAGAHLEKKYVPWVPLLIMMLSDMVIGLHDMILFTWGAFLIIGFIGIYLKGRKTPVNIAGASVISAILFFIITNFGVWLVWYPNTASGLVACYVKALPFLRNTLISNLVFSFAFFGIYEFASRYVKMSRLRTVLLTEN